MRINEERGLIINTCLGMNGLDLQRRLVSIQRSVLQDKNELIGANPSWNIRTDARITRLNHLFTSLDRTRLGRIFLGELLDDDWFQHNFIDASPQHRIDYAVGFERSVKYNFGMDFITGIEISFRIFLRAIDPLACNNTTGAFKAIYECLLGSRKLNFPTDERTAAKELLDLSRLLRNLIHNGGVYFSEDGQNETTNYKGETYTFQHGQPVNFVYWKLLLELADDIRQLLVKVISHSIIVSTHYIPDPFVVRFH